MLTFMIIGIAVGVLFYALNIISNPSSQMSGDALISTYECGFETVSDQSRLERNISYYLVAMLYVVFDLEIALILPGVVCIGSLGSVGTIVLLAIMTLLCLAFVYELNLGTFSVVNPIQ